MKEITKYLKSGAILHGYLHDEHASKKRRTILIFPGGGYTYCSEREGKPVALAYMKHGYQTFVLEYITRNSTSCSAIWESANEAMELLFQMQEEWYVKWEECIVIGFSAGGHLAGMLAVSGSIRPCAVILCYPVIIDSLARLLSLNLHGVDGMVDKKTPPIFVFSTFEDHVVPVRNTLRLLQALNDMHLPFESHIFQWGHHGLSLASTCTADGDIRNIDEHAANWFPLSIAWLDRLFKEPKKIHKHYTHRNETPIEIRIQSDEDSRLIYDEFPLLKNKEIMEALGHFTLSELRKRLKNR